MQRTAHGDVRVPITWAYNHHYGPILAGEGTELKNVALDGPRDPRNHGHALPNGTVWVAEPACSDLAGEWHDTHSGGTLVIKQNGCKIVATGAVSWSPASGEVAHDKVTMRFGADTETATYAYENLDWSNHAEWTRGAAPPPGSKLPTSQTFYIGNGGEYRKSYHGMPPGTAQVVASPSVFHIQPMQIDTKNRDGSMETPEQGFTPGPYPKSAVAPRTGPDATYSGLLVSPRATLRHPPPASLLTPPPARFGRNARAPIASRRR